MWVLLMVFLSISLVFKKDKEDKPWPFDLKIKQEKVNLAHVLQQIRQL